MRDDVDFPPSTIHANLPEDSFYHFFLLALTYTFTSLSVTFMS